MYQKHIKTIIKCIKSISENILKYIKNISRNIQKYLHASPKLKHSKDYQQFCMPRGGRLENNNGDGDWGDYGGPHYRTLYRIEGFKGSLQLVLHYAERNTWEASLRETLASRTADVYIFSSL